MALDVPLGYICRVLASNGTISGNLLLHSPSEQDNYSKTPEFDCSNGSTILDRKYLFLFGKRPHALMAFFL
jgi:hypothetical protein